MPAASSRSSLPVGPISWMLAGSGPRAGTGSASDGTPARLTGEVRPRMRTISRDLSSVGGNPSSVGNASRSTRSQSDARLARQCAAYSQAAATAAGVMVLACRSRASTSRPIWSGRVSACTPSDAHASASRTVIAAAVTRSSPSRPTGITSQPVAASAASIASSMTGSASSTTRPTTRGVWAATANPGSSSSIPAMSPATSRAIGPTVSRLGASGHTPVSGIRPQVVLSPAIPQQAAGMRIDPPVSDPYETSASPLATATAEPLEEPPGTRSGSSGLTGVPKAPLMPLIP